MKNTLDSDGDLARVQSKKTTNAPFWTYAQNFTYNVAGAVSSMQLGNLNWESTVFNSRLQPMQIALGRNNNTTDLLKLDYNYGGTNNNGNVLSQTIIVPNSAASGPSNAFTAIQNYNYDSLNRIKDAKENIDSDPVPSWRQTFDYDRYGNRRFDTGTDENGAKTTTLVPGCATAVCNPQIDPATNKLIGYSFDASGNTKIDAENRQFIYDGENKQVEVKDQNGASIGKYFYNGDGQRVKKISATETTVFVYNADGKLVAEYSNQIAQGQDARASYLTTDHLGSPRITTDTMAQVVSRRDFQPFGEEIARVDYGTDDLRQRFTSYERDTETELDFAQARMFNDGAGRFTSPDPLTRSMKVWSPQSFNRYSYVGNNPTNFSDPSGLCAKNGGGDDGKACPDYSGKVYTNPKGGFSNYACDGCTLYTGGTQILVVGGMNVQIASSGWTTLGEAASSVAEVTVEAGYGVLEDSIITVGEDAIQTVISPRPLIPMIGTGVGALAFILTATPPGGSQCQIETHDDFCGRNPNTTLDLQPDTGQNPATTTSEDDEPSGPFFQRNGATRQSLAQLTAQAEAAERAGFGYGVSVNLVPRPTTSNSRVASTGAANAAFQVKPTPTRNNPNHHTVIFPKPLNAGTVNRFYNTFRRP